MGIPFFVSACFLDEKDLKLNEDEQLRTIDRHCIAEFLEKKGINTRGKLLKIRQLLGYRITEHAEMYGSVTYSTRKGMLTRLSATELTASML